MYTFEFMAILGRQPELGLVELESLLGREAVRPLGSVAAVFHGELEIRRLGGVVKLGRILYEGPVTDLQSLPIDAASLPIGESKTPFAMSLYGTEVSRKQAEAAGLALKKVLRARGSVRLVMPTAGPAVTAAGLHHNRVLEDGFELLIVVAADRMVVAQTLGVQDVDWYSRRDYGRPARDAKVGMLPPKLAQVLVNTTRAPVVADPFCGTGVVLAEALLVGRVAHGSDLAPEMVAAARANLAWLAAEVQRRAPELPTLPRWEVAEADALSVRLPEGAAVVSEGYLGAPQVHSPAPAELERLRRELLGLYTVALANWAQQLPTGAEVSLCAPAWRVGRQWEQLGLVDELARLGYTQKVFRHVPTPLLYARDDQVVGRQLLFLCKG
jgi:hypothetical protein